MTKSRTIYGRPPVERYEEKIDRTTTPNGCHPWTAGERSRGRGYGGFWVNGETTFAHRWGYEHYIGPVPDGLIIRHTCDNPPCQNRAHWVLGTNKDNTADMVDRGRQVVAQGINHYRASLTDAQVLEIRAMYVKRPYIQGGVTQQQIADQFGIKRHLVGLIVRRKRWKHI